MILSPWSLPANPLGACVHPQACCPMHTMTRSVFKVNSNSPLAEKFVAKQKEYCESVNEGVDDKKCSLSLDFYGSEDDKRNSVFDAIQLIYQRKSCTCMK